MESKELNRREFIKNISVVGGSGLLFTTFPWLESFASSNQEAIKGEKARIAIIGTGSRGQFHIQNLLNVVHAEIVAICDNYQPNLDLAAALCPKAKKYTDYRDVLQSKDVQGILNATPLHVHSIITIAGLKAGKHVFCEKSMARTVEQCKEMYDAYKQTGKVLFIGHQRMFDPKYLKALEMVHSGAIGEIVGLRNFWFRNNDWRRVVPSPSLERKINWRLYKDSSGGLMTELGTHQIQMGTWALKSLPDYILGSGDLMYWKDGREVYDNVQVIYHYPNGVKLTFESIISNKFYGMGEEILGDKGTIELDKGKLFFEEIKPAPGIQQLVNQIEHKIFDVVPVAGPSWVPETASENKGENIVDLMHEEKGGKNIDTSDDGSKALVSAFCDSVITGKAVPNLVEEAYYASVLSLLGLQAMDEKRIITFPEELKIPYLYNA